MARTRAISGWAVCWERLKLSMERTRAILSAVASARLSAVYIAPHVELKRSAAAEVACMESSRWRLC
eukprot:355550-Chlamydomonas_euryale.AAC.8